MIQLTIKELAPYLPYGLRAFIGKEIYIIDGLLLSENDVYTSSGIITSLSNSAFKPILRNLSDLTKEIEHEGERFIPLDWLMDNGETYPYMVYGGDLILTEEDIIESPLSMNYVIISKLHQWHFDTFGLIEDGLAVDINSLTKTKDHE